MMKEEIKIVIIVVGIFIIALLCYYWNPVIR